MIQLLIYGLQSSMAYINIKNNNFSSSDGLFAHAQKQDITLQSI
jgi:hypothetical protein